MITIYIHIKEKEQAIKLANDLLIKGLVANASIDYDNLSLTKVNGNLVELINNIITLQTKGLLFSLIVDHVSQNYGKDVKIYSQPITQCNEVFSEQIRINTIKI